MAVVAIGAIIAGASAAAAAYAAGAALALSIGIGIAVAAVSALMSTTMTPNVPRFNSSDTATTLGTTSDPSSVIPIIYGEQRTGTINVWKAVGHDTTYLVQIFAICEGEVDSFSNLYMDNQKILNPGTYRDGILSRDAITSEYRDFVEIEFSTGKSYGHVFTLAQKYLGKEASGWPDTATGNNVASVCIVMRKRNKDLQNQADILQPNSQVAVDVRGRLITDLTTGEKTATNNGPSQVVDYLTNNRYGLGIQLDKIDIESFKEAARHAKLNSLFSDGATDPNGSFKENLTQLAGAFNGIITESFGKVTCRIDGPDIVQYDFNEDNINASSVSLASGGSENYYNTLNVKYQDPLIDYSDQVLRYPSDVTNDGTIALDKRIIAKDINYRFVKSKSQLDKIASIERNKSMLKQVISFSTTDAYTVQVWDVIRVNFEELELTNSLWRVTNVGRPMDKGAAGNVTITASEYIEEVYTDLDYAKDPNNNGSNIPNKSVLIAPKNLAVKAVAETALGRTLKVQWTSEQDYNRAGYYVQYSLAGQNSWIQAGFTSGDYYMIMSLDPNQKFDIRVCASGVIYRSEWAYVNNVNPEVTYNLPSVTGLHLVNFVEDQYTTNKTQFEFAWDDQSAQKFMVDDTLQTFGEVFQYYEITITGQRSNTYRTKDLSFIYDFNMNLGNGLSRELKVSVIAYGHAGMKSDPTVITVKNNQAPAIKGFSSLTGPGMLMCSWNDPTDNEMVPDFKGTIIQLATDQNFNEITKVFSSSSNFLDNFPLEDGQYYARAAWYDAFGQDKMTWSESQFIDMKWTIPWTDDMKEQLNDLLDLDKRVDGAIDEALDLANKYTDTKVSASEQKVTTELNQTITTKNTELHTQITNETNGAINQAISIQESNFDGKLNSAITKVEKTQADDRQASASSISQLKAETNSAIATVSQESKASVDELTGTINSKWAVQTNADGVVAGISMMANKNPNGSKNSSIIFNADKVAITNNNTPAGAVAPFMVADNRVYMDSAMIRNASIGSAQIADASIKNAKIENGAISSAKIGNAQIGSAQIAQELVSDNWHSSGGSQGWSINKNGQANFKNVNVKGNISADSGYFRGRIEATDGYFSGTIYANKLEGDVGAFRINCYKAISQYIPKATWAWFDMLKIKKQSFDQIVDIKGALRQSDSVGIVGTGAVVSAGMKITDNGSRLDPGYNQWAIRMYAGGATSGGGPMNTAMELDGVRLIDGDWRSGELNVESLRFVVPAGTGHATLRYGYYLDRNGALSGTILARYDVFIARNNDTLIPV